MRTMLAGLAAAIGLAGAAPHAGACIPTDWVRHAGPVYRDRIAWGLYEVASDPHVVFTEAGGLAMIYSGDDGGQSSIKLALGTGWTEWTEWGVLLGPSKQPGAVAHKETAFYLRIAPRDHRIYFIGYDDEAAYRSDVYVARAPRLTGPWTIAPDPVVRRGLTDGRAVELITSPSVVEHRGRLIMAYLGWDGFEDVTEVWAFTAASGRDGRSWTDGRVADVPVGMEGQLAARPDGGFVAVATREAEDGREGIFAACADAPEGPWTTLPDPLLTLAGDAWEVDEIIAPSIVFDPATGAPRLFYAAAEHARGWRIMMAAPAPSLP